MLTDTVQKWTHLCSIMAGNLAPSRAGYLPLGKTAIDTCLSTLSAQRKGPRINTELICSYWRTLLWPNNNNSLLCSFGVATSPEHIHHKARVARSLGRFGVRVLGDGVPMH